MPYERCIETWAREEGIGLIPGPGRRGAGQSEARPGTTGLAGRSDILIRICRCEKWPFSRLFYEFSIRAAI